MSPFRHVDVPPQPPGGHHFDPLLFLALLPFPYRVSILLVLGVWGWGVNLHCLSIAKIDVPYLVRYTSRLPSLRLAAYQTTYHFASLLSSILSGSIVTYWLLSHGNISSAMAWQFIPNFTLIGLLLCFIPRSLPAGTGRARLKATLRRISIGGLALNQDGRFGDVLLADVLTSYAKPIADLFAIFWMMFTAQNTCSSTPNRMCGGGYLVPVLIAIPSTIRFRQCLIEYSRARAEGAGGGQHLANALKYSTAFPVIIVNAMMRGRSVGDGVENPSMESLVKIWWVAIVLNSMYSFYWDITYDWDLTIISDLLARVGVLGSRRKGTLRLVSPTSPSSTTTSSTLASSASSVISLPKPDSLGSTPPGLRSHRVFESDWSYYAAILADFLLRCAPWACRFFSVELHDRVSGSEAGVYLLQALEILRRWIWLFFRIETEWVRVLQNPLSSGLSISSDSNRD